MIFGPSHAGFIPARKVNEVYTVLFTYSLQDTACWVVHIIHYRKAESIGTHRARLHI